MSENQPPDDSGNAADLDELVRSLRRLDRDNKELFGQLVEGERRFRGLARAVWRVQEEERRRIARELHDGLGQTLTALKIRLQLMAREAEDPLASQLQGAVEIAHVGLEEARRLSHLLRPRVLDDLGLLPALRWLGRTISGGTGFKIHLELGILEKDPEAFDPDFETLIFRIVQEALTNALKHSTAGAAEVRFESRGEFLLLVIQDEGKGFDPAALDPRDGAGNGLAGIRDRAEIFGGRIRVISAPNEGTRIEVLLPRGQGSATS